MVINPSNKIPITIFFINLSSDFSLCTTCSCMESCVFEGEDFPKENRKPANKQQTLC